MIESGMKESGVKESGMKEYEMIKSKKKWNSSFFCRIKTYPEHVSAGNGAAFHIPGLIAANSRPVSLNPSPYYMINFK